MEQMTKRSPKADAVQAIAESEQVRTANAVLTSVQTGFKIASREDNEQAADSLNILKRTINYVADGLTEVFRPDKALEKSLRQLLEPSIAGWKRGAVVVDGEMTRWRRAEEARIREEQVRAQREADAAAKAAAEAAALLMDDEEAPPPVQVVVPRQETITRGAVGKAHLLRRTEAVEIVDAVAVARACPQWLLLDKAAAKATFDTLVSRGVVEPPPEGDGVVIEGVRFRTVVTNVSGRA